MNWNEIRQGPNGVQYVPLEEANRAIMASSSITSIFPSWIWFVIIVIAIFAIGLMLWGIVFEPRWNVWNSRKKGEAQYQHSLNEQKIQIAEAQSRLAAAEINKQAAVIEAEAVSAQVQSIGAQLTQHNLYLQWQWIKMMEDRGGDTIYVPTEAGLPILEANRRS